MSPESLLMSSTCSGCLREEMGGGARGRGLGRDWKHVLWRRKTEDEGRGRGRGGKSPKPLILEVRPSRLTPASQVPAVVAFVWGDPLRPRLLLQAEEPPPTPQFLAPLGWVLGRTVGGRWEGPWQERPRHSW